jgi:hypothetical protein
LKKKTLCLCANGRYRLSRRKRRPSLTSGREGGLEARPARAKFKGDLQRDIAAGHGNE